MADMIQDMTWPELAELFKQQARELAAARTLIDRLKEETYEYAAEVARLKKERVELLKEIAGLRWAIEPLPPQSPPVDRTQFKDATRMPFIAERPGECSPRHPLSWTCTVDSATVRFGG